MRRDQAAKQTSSWAGLLHVTESAPPREQRQEVHEGSRHPRMTAGRRLRAKLRRCRFIGRGECSGGEAEMGSRGALVRSGSGLHTLWTLQGWLWVFYSRVPAVGWFVLKTQSVRLGVVQRYRSGLAATM